MENQNQNNLIGSQNQNNTVITVDINAIFAGDSYGLFVFKKTERLVRAIYLLTSLMSDTEPMKERVRELSNAMLENVIAMSERIWGEETYQKNLISAISEIFILFDIAESTKMMSKMNHQIITSELKKLADFLATSLTNYSSAKIAFEPNLFDGDYNYVPDQTFKAASSTQNQNVIKKDDVIKDINTSKGQNQISVEDKKNNQNEKMSLTKTPNLPKDKNNRQDIILSMLKSGVKLSVKDFAMNIKDCSEKTIQRELLSLVSKGVLKKEGERRWSKYFLAK